jgi:pilus assembly protein CpaD
LAINREEELIVMTKFQNSVLIGFSLAVSACGGTQNRGLESVHQPVISRTDYVFDVNASGGGLSGEEVRRLSGWFQSLRIGYGDHVSVDSSNSYGDQGARDSVAALAARYGLLIDDAAPVTAGEIAPGNVRVIVSRVAASVPGCPDWSRKSQPEFNGNGMSNYGCATNSNLAAMVANPEDLVSGQIGSPVSSAASATKAIKTYRDAPNSGKEGLKAEGTSK